MMPTDKTIKSFSVIVDDEHIEQTEEVAKSVATSLGLKVDQVVPLAGAFRVYGSDNDVPGIKSLKGVGSVEVEKNYSLPPSDPDIPQ